ncbi:MAG: hypothetical protein HY774_15660 [Acidobacteria bacterium]|nr:hypothetical protein [Acidobacteriota bacterium]
MMNRFKKITLLGVMLAVFGSILAIPTSIQAHERSKWSKYRTPITIAGGTLAGAGIGGLAGGRKGAVIGAIAGAGSSSIFEIVRTKRDKKNDDRYYRNNRSSKNRCHRSHH